LAKIYFGHTQVLQKTQVRAPYDLQDERDILTLYKAISNCCWRSNVPTLFTVIARRTHYSVRSEKLIHFARLIFTPNRDERISDTPTTENIAANGNSMSGLPSAIRAIFVCAAAKAQRAEEGGGCPWRTVAFQRADGQL
jgi:hypothetical protein